MKFNGLFLLTYLLIALACLFLNTHYNYLSNPLNLGELVHTRSHFGNSHGVWDKDYLKGPQKLALNRLELNVWGGFHEVTLEKTFSTKNLSLEFTYALSKDSYLYFYFDNLDLNQAHGLRLSLNPFFPSLLFSVNSEGKFLKRVEQNFPLEEGINQFKVSYQEDKILFFNNEKKIFQLDGPLKKEVRFGWSGSQEETPVWIDDLKVQNSTDNYQKSFSYFENSKNFKNSFYVVLALFLFFLLLYFFIKEPSNRLAFNLSLIFILTSSSALFYFYYGPRYFGSEYEPVDEGYVEMRMKELKEDFLEDEEKIQKKKVFFYGGSKTFGDGSGSKQQIWVNRLLKKLVDKDKRIKDLEFINWGIPAASSTEILALHKKNQSESPLLEVFYTGVNDFNTDLYIRNLKEIVSLNKKRGIPTFFIEESVYINSRASIPYSFPFKNFDALLSSLCKERLVTCIKLRELIYDPEKKLYDSGLRWAEWVHNNSYGQDLLSDLILNDFLRFFSSYEG